MAELEKLREEYRQMAEFVIVYIKEAHPEDEWQLSPNTRQGVVHNQPKSFEQRLDLARTFVAKMEVGTLTLVDDMSNTANACFAAWPERIYIIDTAGTIVYKGGMGPYRFKPQEVAEFLDRYPQAKPALD